MIKSYRVFPMNSMLTFVPCKLFDFRFAKFLYVTELVLGSGVKLLSEFATCCLTTDF